MPAAHLSCNGALNHARNHLSRLGGLQNATRNDCNITDSRSALEKSCYLCRCQAMRCSSSHDSRSAPQCLRPI